MIRLYRNARQAVEKFFRAVKWYTVIQIAVLIGRLRRRQQIVSVWPEGPVALGPKIVLFMHFDRNGRVRAQLLAYIREFIANGRQVIFVTNSGKLAPASDAELRKLCVAVMVRRNRGYDFGAWREVIEHFGLPRAETEEIILANDSVFGPLRPLAGVFERLDYAAADIWGLTESWQSRYHLQSFFLAFGPAAIRDGAWQKFWQSVWPVPAKSFIVKSYEVGVSQVMMKAGLSCAALWPYEALTKLVDTAELEKLIAFQETDLGKEDPIHVTRKLQILRIRDCVARRIAMNPSADLWRQLLMQGFPFIKRELLRDNPTEVQDIGDWMGVVRDALGVEPDVILHDLRLMLKDQAP
jgi:hypothetical protein